MTTGPPRATPCFGSPRRPPVPSPVAAPVPLPPRPTAGATGSFGRPWASLRGRSSWPRFLPADRRSGQGRRSAPLILARTRRRPRGGVVSTTCCGKGGAARMTSRPPQAPCPPSPVVACPTVGGLRLPPSTGSATPIGGCGRRRVAQLLNGSSGKRGPSSAWRRSTPSPASPRAPSSSFSSRSSSVATPVAHEPLPAAWRSSSTRSSATTLSAGRFSTVPSRSGSGSWPPPPVSGQQREIGASSTVPFFAGATGSFPCWATSTRSCPIAGTFGG